MLEFRVLGPLEVLADGRLLALGPPQQRAVLAALALRAGEAVAVDALFDALWADAPPASAQNLVQGYVGKLRALLEPDRVRGGPPRMLLTRSPGYLLAVKPEQVDARQFERLVKAARSVSSSAPGVTAVKLREALALWRGEVLSDLRAYEIAVTERVRLEQLRRAAVDERIDADLALGRYTELIAELEASVAADPLGEHSWAQLMTALYGAGRQADALRAYGSVRQILDDELGLDPGPELQSLERAILRQDLKVSPRGREQRQAAHNLPAALTSFVGRQDELGEVAGLLRQARSVTLIGPGGCGKTRLALEAAASIMSDFPDGVWQVDLGLVTEPAMVATAIAAAFDIPEEPGRSLFDTLGEHLRDSGALMVLDNCEHLVDACAELVSRLLRTCPALRVLATSRTALQLSGEVVWPVPPLADPEAVRLFTERAAAASGFRLTTRTEKSVERICVRLDGMPLAIEMAAARSRSLSAGEIADGLADRFRLLDDGVRGAPARQRTLRAMVDWSYELLSESERILFDRLSVFAGGFSVESAEAVTDSGADTPGLLGRLVDKSFVVRGEGLGGLARYRLLKTLRQYGQERLAERRETKLLARRHATYYAELAERGAAALVWPVTAGQTVAWLDRFDEERPDVHSAIAWAFDGGEATLGVTIVRTVCFLWHLRGPIDAGRTTVERALAHTDPCAPALRMGLLHGLGNLAISQADFTRAVEAGEECLSLARRHGDQGHIGWALGCLGWVAWVHGDAERGRLLLEQAIATMRQVGVCPIMYLAALGWLLSDQGEDAHALTLLDEAVATARAIGEPMVLGFALESRAGVACRQRDDRLAASLSEEALAAYRTIGYPEPLGRALTLVARVAARRGAHQRAAQASVERLALCHRLGNFARAVRCLEDLGAAAAALDRAGMATRLLAAAKALRAMAGGPLCAPEPADHHDQLAALRTSLGDDVYSTEWIAGGALTLDQALAEAQALTR